MAVFFISVAILGVALVFGACFLIAELFWPIVAILVVFFLWKLVSQRKNEDSGGNEKPFNQEQEKD